MDKRNSSGRAEEAIVLIVIVALITLLHYSTLTSGNLLLHEISQRLYYVPIIYAAYRFGLKGGVAFSVLSGIIYLVHISEHTNQTIILNQYAEVIMFLVVGITTGFFANAEMAQRRKFEQTSEELVAAYQELRNTVDLLVRAARLKSLGELAAAITHEIRNPLGAIKGAVEIIETEIPAGSPKREFVIVIEREIARLNRLIDQFLKFSRPQEPEKALTNLNELIGSVINFIAGQAAKKQIKLINQLDDQLPLIEIDGEQIKQVLLNLILNSIDAMAAGGEILISSRRSNNDVEFEVRDQGIGIDPSQRERIFDPFFTTKPQGSGLGLSIAYQLIKQHNGEILLNQLDQPGTSILVRLPIAAKASLAGK